MGKSRCLEARVGGLRAGDDFASVISAQGAEIEVGGLYGDDFTFTGEDSGHDWLVCANMVRSACGRGVGHGLLMTKRQLSLGRRMVWNDWGVSCEADTRYRASVMWTLGLEEDLKASVSPGGPEEEREDVGRDEGLGGIVRIGVGGMEVSRGRNKGT